VPVLRVVARRRIRFAVGEAIQTAQAALSGLAVGSSALRRSAASGLAPPVRSGLLTTRRSTLPVVPLPLVGIGEVVLDRSLKGNRRGVCSPVAGTGGAVGMSTWRGLDADMVGFVNRWNRLDSAIDGHDPHSSALAAVASCRRKRQL
jgi:hypothetical protein